MFVVPNDEQPKRSRKERATAQQVNDPKRIRRERTKRQAKHRRQKGNGKPPGSESS